jgi:hypothetical protein
MSKRKMDMPVAALKASEGQVASWLASILQVPAADKVAIVLEVATDDGAPRQLVRALNQGNASLYPWVVDVMSSILSVELQADLCDLLSEVISSPGEILLVRDKLRSAKNSIWAVVAGPAEDFEGLPYRSVSNHVKVGDRNIKVTAFHVTSCAR